MAKELLNHFINTQGNWQTGQMMSVESLKAVNIGNRDVRIHETSRSGGVTLSATGGPLMGYGDPEVFVKITYASAATEYLSAPLRTPLEFKAVAKLELGIAYAVGNHGVSRVAYAVCINAHCIFEKI